jgi:hypothetical protein
MGRKRRRSRGDSIWPPQRRSVQEGLLGWRCFFKTIKFRWKKEDAQIKAKKDVKQKKKEDAQIKAKKDIKQKKKEDAQIKAKKDVKQKKKKKEDSLKV